MDACIALSENLSDDFIVSGNCQEKQNSKDIERTNLKVLSRICGSFILKYIFCLPNRPR